VNRVNPGKGQSLRIRLIEQSLPQGRRHTLHRPCRGLLSALLLGGMLVGPHEVRP
jgi:hypothetical protein